MTDIDDFKKQYEDGLINHKEMLRLTGEYLTRNMIIDEPVSELEALVTAYQAIENDIMHGIPNRLRILATIQEMIVERLK